MAEARPVAPSERIRSIDVVRGIAICAVLIVNVVGMTGPQFGMLDPDAWMAPRAIDRVVFHLVRTFVEGKFISIFCLLFGVGLALQTQRLDAAGRSTIYLRRQGFLALMGIVHGVLFWYGDILFVYAIVGTLAFFLRTISPPTLRTASLILIGAGAVALGSSLASVAAVPTDYLDEALAELRAIELPPDIPGWLRGVLAEDDFFRMFSAFEVAMFTQLGWGVATLYRGALFLGTALGSLTSMGMMLLGLFTTGIWLVKTDFFADTPDAGARRRRWTAWGLCIGLVLEGLGGGLAQWGGHDLMAPATAIGEGLRTFAKPIQALGTFALLVHLSTGSIPLVLRPFEAAGRLALTNYILPSVVFAFVAVKGQWVGLGWYGALHRADAIGLAMLLMAVLVLLSNLWLTRFRMGPLEWVWRRATYGSMR
jgi:uncharacterized protein